MIYAGIDEAGYGPRIGPLAVGLSVFEVTAAEPLIRLGHAPVTPDLWTLLRGVVRRACEVGRTRAALYVDDSKRLKGAPSVSGRHPLDRIEKGVLAFLHALGAEPTTDEELYASLGTCLEAAPWYVCDPLAAPLSTTWEHLRTLSNGLKSGLARRGVTPLLMRCELIGEGKFNEIVSERGSKAIVNFAASAAHLREVWERYGQRAPVVAMDRQGGRIRYGALLGDAIHRAEVRTIEETNERSVYELTDRGDHPERRMIVLVEVGADSMHLPTALASMTAKLVRELAMIRLNRHWCARVPALRPTAGYGADANRWLREVAPSLSAGDLARLVRLA